MGALLFVMLFLDCAISILLLWAVRRMEKGTFW